MLVLIKTQLIVTLFANFAKLSAGSSRSHTQGGYSQLIREATQLIKGVMCAGGKLSRQHFLSCGRTLLTDIFTGGWLPVCVQNSLLPAAEDINMFNIAIK